MKKTLSNIIRTFTSCLAVTAAIVGINTVFPEEQYEVTIHSTICEIDRYTDGYSTMYDLVCEVPHEIGGDDLDYVSYPTADPGYSIGQNVDVVMWYGADCYEIIDLK